MPVIAVAREIKRLHPGNDLEIHYIGPKDELSLLLLAQENIKAHTIVAGKIRRYFSFENFIDVLFKIPFGFLQSFFLALFMMPKLVFSKGGSGSLVVCLCAYILGRPIFVHESDSAPGISNKIVSKWAKKVFTSFPRTEYFDLSKTLLVGNPIRKEITEGSIQATKEIFNLTLEKPVVLFLGGSQGAQALNDFVLSILNDLLQDYEVIHLCGSKNYRSVKIESQVVLDKELEKYYHLWEFLDEVQLKHALSAASIVISRAGAGSIFEIAACGKPSILIPLPSSASDHQSKNAYQYASTGAAVVIEQENMTHNFFIGKINYLLSNSEKMDEMKKAALQFAKPLAAKAIAREILEYLA